LLVDAGDRYCIITRSAELAAPVSRQTPVLPQQLKEKT
jgi:hypothetical protein